MRSTTFLKIAVLACVLVLCLTTAAFATNVNQSSATSNNTNNAGGIVGYVPPDLNNSSIAVNSDTNLNQSQVTNLYSGTIQDETMLIIPIMTMLEESGGLLFTALLAGVVLGIVGTLLVQRARKGKQT